ncbi:type II secretion system protein [Sulfurospirillum cavolei]|uniref:type II secretion system protein n=1 Tax=Sulfurospirillum cavolei TaxID=366522 RepID=UPI000764B16C|nr:type II secretion system protein [Sulfurospirillum cavolei]
MKKRSAFTLIELVMVIVVFGIIASIGAEIITKMYENYLRTRAINRLQSQTEITLEQVAKRLQYRIKDSVRASNDNGASWRALPNAIAGYDTIEWIGISNESFLGEHNGTSVVPGWSGLIDMNDTVNTSHAARTLSTPGSRLDFTNNIIKSLTDNNVAMDGTAIKHPALIFKGAKPGTFSNYYENAITIGNNPYARKVRCVGNNCAANFSTLQLLSNAANDDLIDYDGDGNGDLFEQYYLAHSAYALAPIGAADDFNLTLYYNYQPWEGETYTPNGTSTVLAEHVSTFRIRQDGDSIRIKLCIHDANQSIASNFDFSACKEKVIY